MGGFDHLAIYAPFFLSVITLGVSSSTFLVYYLLFYVGRFLDGGVGVFGRLGMRVEGLERGKVDEMK